MLFLSSLAEMHIPNYRHTLCLIIRNIALLTFAVSNPSANCPSLFLVPTPTPAFSVDSMVALLGSHDAVENFFELSFERTYMRIPFSDRKDRREWLQLYRRFLPHHDIDALLSHNASAFKNGSLTLHRDLDLIRPTESGDELVDTLLEGAKEIHAIDLDSVHRAFRDGFGVLVYAMDMRSAVVADMVEGLRAFWMVGVSADMGFVPGSAVKAEVKIFAEDTFYVVMEGTLDVILYEELFLFPTRRHVEDESFAETVRGKLGEVKGTVVETGEGDVLYVPRGCGIEIRGTANVNLYIILKVNTEESCVADGIVATMKAVRERALESPLDKRLESRGGVEYDATWGDVFESAVIIAAEFLPQLRRFMALGGGSMEIIEEVGGLVGEEFLGEEVRKFVEAASRALFEGVTDILGGKEEINTGMTASTELIAWARRAVKEGDRRKLERWFKICLALVAEEEVDVQNGFMELQLRRTESEMRERGERLEWKDRILRRHGVTRGREENGKEYSGNVAQR